MSLDVYLYDVRIGTLFPAGDHDYRFAYDADMVEALGPGRGLLSAALPVRREPFSAEATRAYIEGLLPEGQRRARIGRELGIDAADGYQLIAEIGADCPGAVCFVPQGEEVRHRGPEEVSWLSDEELAELLDPQPPAYFSEDSPRRMRSALPGNRHKLSLVYDRYNDRWGWPEAGVPSTHVIKPDTGERPGMLANEMFCSALLREIEMPVVRFEMREIAGRRCLVSPRYDRTGSGWKTSRLHSESFVQALGIEPFSGDAEEEGAHEPRFSQATGLIHALSNDEDMFNLILLAFCNFMIGNGDAHGRNMAMINARGISLDDPRDVRRMAPLTDLFSTAIYDDPMHLGMTIPQAYDGGVYLIELAEIAEECELDFGYTQGMASLTAVRFARTVETIATRAIHEDWHEAIVDKLVKLICERAETLAAEIDL